MKMKECPSSSKLFVPSYSSGLRLSLTLIIVLIVMSSPIFILANPASAASPYSTDANTLAPSTLSQDGGSDFTTQALDFVTARPTNNIVNTKSFYDVVFVTSFTAAIKKIEVSFPAGTIVPISASFTEAEGIGPGTVSTSGQHITYTVNNAVNVPAGTKIRLEFSNINNPQQPSSNYKVTVTTRNAANAIIDGPTQSTAYTIKQIGTNALADNAVTTPKIADDAVTTSKIDNGAVIPVTDSLADGPFTVPPNSIVTGTASCQPPGTGTHVTGGGYVQADNSHSLVPIENYDGGLAEGWLVKMFNSDTVNSHAFLVYANCISLIP